MTLSLFGRWLSAEQNRLQWVALLLSFITLKHGGVHHITKAAVDQRSKMLEFAFGLSGVPWPLAAAVEISDLKKDVSNARFIPYQCQNNAPKMLALVPRGAPVEPPSKFAHEVRDRLATVAPSSYVVG